MTHSVVFLTKKMTPSYLIRTTKRNKMQGILMVFNLGDLSLCSRRSALIFSYFLYPTFMFSCDLQSASLLKLLECALYGCVFLHLIIPYGSLQPFLALVQF